jgi:broad specificity phosphatase PhoE
MRLYFIRHAQSSNNALYDATGAEVGRSDDPELTPLGVQQARALGDFLERGTDPLERGKGAAPSTPEAAREGAARDGAVQPARGAALTHLYTSPMTRAVQTSLEVARGTGLTPLVWEDWHEAGGIWLEEGGVRVGREGKDRVYFQQHFPNVQLPEGYADKGWWSRAYETDAELYPRAARAWKTLLERHGETRDRVAIVSHGLFYAYVVAVAFGLPSLEGVFFVMNNTGVTRVDHKENAHGTTNLVYANRLAHLEDTQVS